MRSPRRGRLEIWTAASSLGEEQTQRLLGYLASEAGIALDNASLYRETEEQKEQLRTFVNEVIATEERDSRQLALDLHDGLVQQIVAAYQHLQTAQVWRERDPGVEERELERGIRILKQSIVEARRLISQLRPAGLDDFGLARAVRLFANQQAAANEWGVELQVDAYWPALPSHGRGGAVSHHPRGHQQRPQVCALQTPADRACRCKISIWTCWCATGGAGFDPNAVLSRPEQGLRLGLVGIRERTNLLGGSCEIISAPGEGASVLVHLPREQAQREGVMIRVLLVDDQAIVREGLRSLLAPEPDMVVVGEAADGREAIGAAQTLQPDVVLLDVRMPNMDGLAALGKIKEASPRQQRHHGDPL